MALARDLSHLPVIADPSHGTGKQSLIAAVSRAAVAVGADGLIIEVHPCPERALSDGAQSLDFAGFEKVMRAIAEPLRRVAVPACAGSGLKGLERRAVEDVASSRGQPECAVLSSHEAILATSSVDAAEVAARQFDLHRGIAEQIVRSANRGIADAGFRFQNRFSQRWV